MQQNSFFSPGFNEDFQVYDQSTASGTTQTGEGQYQYGMQQAQPPQDQMAPLLQQDPKTMQDYQAAQPGFQMAAMQQASQLKQAPDLMSGMALNDTESLIPGYTRLPSNTPINQPHAPPSPFQIQPPSQRPGGALVSFNNKVHPQVQQMLAQDASNPDVHSMIKNMGMQDNPIVNQNIPASKLETPISKDEFFKSPAYTTAQQAYTTAKSQGVTKNPVMTIVDFSKPATDKRLWVVNANTGEVLMNTWVAQGSGSGKQGVPTQFSNTPDSHQSSLGVFKTGETYQGKHGESMRIQGLEPGINDKAEQRAVVVHGANYIGDGKTGTSWGCFALPQNETKKYIGLTKGNSLIVSYAPNQPWQNQSKFLQGNQQKQGVVSQGNPTNQGGGASSIDNPHPALQNTIQGIAGVEGSKYSTITNSGKKNNPALGKYQILESNLKDWGQAAGYKGLTKEQFLNDPAIQDKVAAHQINSTLQQGYSPQDAASIWFSGRPQAKAGKAKDRFGTSVPQYVNKFNKFAGFDEAPQVKQAPKPLPQVSPSNGIMGGPDMMKSLLGGF